MTPLREVCQGRWSAILPLVGIDSRYLTGKHGPCPICGGRDRFRFDNQDGRGTWICSQCKSGDGISLAMLKNGWDFKEAAAHIEPLAGSAPRASVSRARDQRALKDAMNRLWAASKPVGYGDPVDRYLEARGIKLDHFPSSLRFAQKCRYQDTSPSYHPAMIAKVLAPDGKPATLHRTYLTTNGQKAPVEDVKRLMPGPLPKGSAIRLAGAAQAIGIAEGVETALSAAEVWNIPCWAAVNAAMLMAWEPPPEAREVFVFGDNDKRFGGQASAYALAHRLAMKGINVRVELPSRTGMDWNDVLMAEKAERSAA
jgi:putative DNA primase/helicase